MADPPASASKPPAPSPAQSSPKFIRHKSAALVGAPINVSFGCEHIENFHKTGQNTWKTFEQYYVRALQTIRTENPIVPQSIRNGKTISPSLRPTWLCMQCPFIFSEDARQAHWASPKQHSFYVESRSGCLYCLNCDDYVFDPHLERLRMSNGSKSLKRKYDDYLSPEDYRTVVPNSSLLPCRAIGLRGLYNMGNTCFMSVVLQCLLHNPYIRAFYLSSGHNREDCELPFCVSCALDETYSEFYSLEKTEGFGAVTMLMNSWKTAEASNSDLAGYHQQDAHEYMQFLLNHLHTANGGTQSNCRCIIHSTFYGQLHSVVTCDKCNNRTVAVDPFLDLSLDLRAQVKKKLTGDAKAAEEPGVMRLEECLRRFTSEEKLPATEYSCRKCNAQRDATKQFSVLELPPVLCIHLKRFSHAKDKSSKLSSPIKFPLVLDMLPYSTLYVAPDDFLNCPPSGAKANGTSSSRGQPNGAKPDEPAASQANLAGGVDRAPSYEALLAEPREFWPSDLASYELSAVIVHKGEINSGHYVNYAREGCDWFLFDDSKVVRVDEGDVLRAEAYLLIYVVRDVTPWMETGGESS